MKLFALLLCLFGLALPVCAGLTKENAFVLRFYATYKTKDTVKLAEFYNADATLVDPSFELNLKGRDQIRDLLTKALAKYESLDFEITRSAAAGDEIFVEGTMVGKIGGKTVRVPFVSNFQLKDGKISSQHDMFDVVHFLVQLGVIAPPFGPKPAASPSSGALSPEKNR